MTKIDLKSLINEHARLAFLEFFSTILSFFHVINKQFHLTRLLIYLVNKQAGWHFFPPYSFILVCSFIRDFRVSCNSQIECPHINIQYLEIRHLIEFVALHWLWLKDHWLCHSVALLLSGRDHIGILTFLLDIGVRWLELF